MDPHSIDPARHYPIQKTDEYIRGHCYESSQKIYTPAVHPREPFATSRGMRVSPFYEREVALGGYFMEVAGWERAHGYAANEATLLEKYRDQVPVREVERLSPFAYVPSGHFFGSWPSSQYESFLHGSVLLEYPAP